MDRAFAGRIAAAATLGLAIAGASSLVLGHVTGFDLSIYRTAARALLDGSPVYPAAVARGPADQYVYPPPVLLLFAPFALVPWPMALALWTALLLGVAAALGWHLVHGSGRHRLWAAAAFVGFVPLYWDIEVGNVTLLVTALAVVAWRVRSRAAASGALFALSLLLKPLALPALLFCVVVGHRRVGAWAAAIAGAVVVATLPLVGYLWPDYLRVATTLVGTEVPVTVAQLIPEPLTSAPWRYALPALAIALGWLAARSVRGGAGERAFRWALAAGAILFPVSWYPYLILTLPLTIDLLTSADVAATARVGAVAAWVLMLAQSGPDPRSFALPFLGLALLLFVAAPLAIRPTVRPSRDDLAYLAGLAFGVGVIVATGMPAYRASHMPLNDFPFVWGGARALLEGIDPYDPVRWPAFVSAHAIAGAKETWWIYPPWVAVALLPLGALPKELATDVWTFGGMALAALALGALLRAVLPGRPLAHTLAGAALVASQPGIAGYWSGQWSFVLTAAMAAGVLAVLRGGRLAAAAALALLGKPQLAIPALAGLAEGLRARRRRRELAAMAVAATALLAVSLPLMGGWLGVALASLAPRLTTTRAPTTVTAALADVLGPAGVALGVAVILAAAAAALRLDHRSVGWAAAWTALSIAAAPYAWSYDHLPLLVPLTLGVGVAWRRGRGPLVAALAYGSFLLVPTLLAGVANVRQSETFSALVPLGVLVFVLAAALAARRDALAPHVAS